MKQLAIHCKEQTQNATIECSACIKIAKSIILYMFAAKQDIQMHHYVLLKQLIYTV